MLINYAKRACLKTVLIATYITCCFTIQAQTNFQLTHTDETDKEVIALQNQADSFLTSNELIKCYEQLSKITKIYEGKGEFDKEIHYLKSMVALGKQLEDIPKEIMPLIDMISIQNVLYKGEKEYHENIRKVSNYSDHPELSEYSKSLICIQASMLPEHKVTLDSSIIYAKKAIQYLDGGSKHANILLSNKMTLVRYYKMKGNLLEALLSLLQIEEELKLEDTNEYLIYQIYFQIGSIFKKIEDNSKALQYYQQAYEFASNNKLNELIIQSQSYYGGTQLSLGNHEEGIKTLKDALEKIKNSRFKRSIPPIYLSLGNIHLEMDSIAQAKQYLDSAAANMHYIASTSSTNRFNELNATYYIKIQDKSKAKYHLDLITSISHKKNRLLYLYHKTFNNKSLALQYYEKHINQRDSTTAQNRLITVQRIESEYNRKQQDTEIQSLTSLTAAQDKALSIRNTALIMGSIMLVILAALLFGLYRLFVKNQENQKELARQNKVISEALTQNQMLMKEIHHRVKNNLQVISSLLSMQERKVKDMGTKDALKSSKSRVQSMSILHQNLYTGENLKDIDVDDYMDKLVQNIIDTYNIDQDIQFNIEIDPVKMDIDTLVPLGLISNELICNALKHAFQGRENGSLDVSLKINEDQLTLRVADDGIGFEGDQLPKIEGSLGSRLIQSFTQRLDGKIVIDKSNGTAISILFDKHKMLL